MLKRTLGLALMVMAVAGCPKAQAPTPGAVADKLRQDAPSYEALHRAFAAGPTKNVLLQRETGLAELPLGATQDQVHQRYGDPNHRLKTSEGEWWEFEEVLKLASEDESDSDKPARPEGDKPARNITGTLRLLFKPRPVITVADPAATTAVVPQGPVPQAPVMNLVQIRAWAPGAQETSSLVRLLDPISRVERKYGAPSHKLPVGWGGGEVWIYPAANVAFVISPPHKFDEVEGPPTRIVAGTIVGL